MAQERRIHPSLLRPPFFYGVPLDVLVLELAFLLGLFGLVGFSKTFFVFGALTLLVAHPILGKVTREDPLAIRIFFDAMAYRRVYAARGSLVPQVAVRPRPCIAKA